ncbi:MAG TPA: acetyl-CoA carboxylase biotin carboxylase subunit [Blastocatellia bacterium]|jgi:acetyl-CoA carboxylase biotin carboxylase subunit|nr:acetyl-CoA carboxylase biotin carboxylase subunit [Blastocatellia bacterium]
MEARTFRKILIANRGEIALRVMRSCRVMGIETVAVYSDADAHAPHVRFAGEAVHLGAAPAQESYLRIEKVIEAAIQTGADAIHPGYGFLSENAEFAESCAAAGVVFIGPSPAAIRAMGLKSSARRLAAEAGAPVVPGYDGEDQRVETLRARMIEIGFPVLIKASAGGGGKGMRVVRAESVIDEAVEAARREAEKAFGDGSLLLEKYVEEARHVEVQILGDARGNLVHLFERDCSLQRRHQKIIEESPSPAVDEELRRKMGDTAVNIGRAIGYTNAGTVEFILSTTWPRSGEFYFIEVNTRLQVEHPVTEMITGLDLVRLQIEIAEGRPLTCAQADLKTEGHAIEARLYAEDPANDFLPSTGKIFDLHLPAIQDGAGLRIDSGIESGMEVGIHYDPMLAKLIARGESRDAAIRKLAYALRQSSIQGLRTNRDFLIRLLDHQDFKQGRAHTGFIAEHLAELIADDDPRLNRDSLVAAALYLQDQWRASNELLAELPPSYRNSPYRDPSIRLQIGSDEVEVSWSQTGAGAYRARVFDSTVTAQVLSSTPDIIRIEIDGVQRAFRIAEAADELYVHSSLGSRVIKRPPRHPAGQSASEQASANSPMPGKILKVLVETGQGVSAGDPLIILEAMKMEHTMRAALDGVVQSILVSDGEIVGPGQLLVQIISA